MFTHFKSVFNHLSLLGLSLTLWLFTPHFAQASDGPDICWEEISFTKDIFDAALLIHWPPNPDDNFYKIIYFDCAYNKYEQIIVSDTPYFVIWGPLCILDVYVYSRTSCESDSNPTPRPGGESEPEQDPTPDPEADPNINPKVVVIDDPGNTDVSEVNTAINDLLGITSIPVILGPRPNDNTILLPKTSQSSPTNIIGQTSINCFPNPINTQGVIQINLPQPSTTDIYIVNLVGQVVAPIIRNQKLTEGSHDFVWNADNLPNGLYFCILRTENNLYSIPMDVIK